MTCVSPVHTPTHHVTLDQHAGEIANELGTRVERVCYPCEGSCHVHLENGDCFILEVNKDGFVTRTWDPESYKDVDLSRVREDSLVAKWDTSR
jgi:hypothetical protein